MPIKVLAIGDVGNIVRTLQKYSKKSKIRLIKYPIDGSATFTDPDNIETFKTWKVKEHVQKINEIKDDYDLCDMIDNEKVACEDQISILPFKNNKDISKTSNESSNEDKDDDEKWHVHYVMAS